MSSVPWWKNAIIYQIYPASYKDSNGDGVGDIPGIISELDYIKSLGVTAIWLCPMYDSPQIDMGYDVADYQKVYPPYGTMEDMDVLIDACHKRGLKLLLDLVVNHTSDQHEWFKASRSSKSDPKRDWYIWRPAKYVDGKRQPPNNWRSNFGGSAWAWDDKTEEYYLRLFCVEQPDLNWENEETRKAIYETAMEFWLKKGVDGFRVDTVNMYSKHPSYADAPVLDPSSETQLAHSLFCNGPRMHEYLSEMNAILTKYDAMTVGECPHVHTTEGVLKYVSAAAKQLNMVFEFDVVELGMGPNYKYWTTPRNWKLPDMKAALKRSQALMDGVDGWGTVFIENHDQARSVSRFGSDKTPELRETSAKMLAMLESTLSGTQFVYQGQEIGMVNAPASWPIEEYKDVESNGFYEITRQQTNGDAASLQKVMAGIQHLARDHARMPMQWSGEANAGFSTAKPWMRPHDNYKELNVELQKNDKNSVVGFWRKMLQLRKEHGELFIHGGFELIDEQDEHLFKFTKTAQNSTAFVVLNFAEEPQKFEKPAPVGGKDWELLVGDIDGDGTGKTLHPFEGRVYVSKQLAN